MSSDVKDIDALRHLHKAIIELSDELGHCTTELRQLAYRFQERITVERRQYWANQLHLGERALQEAHESLARAKISQGSDRQARNTEAEIAVARAKRRVGYCGDQLTRCKRLVAEVDRAVDRFIGQLGSMTDLVESSLPRSANRLAAWIDALDLYADHTSPPPGSP